MGMLNYALAIGAIIVPIAQLGSQTILFDKSAKKAQTGIALLLITNRLRTAIFIVVSVVVICFELITNAEKERITILVLILFSCLFTAKDSYKPFFDATLQAKTNSIASQIGLFTALATRLSMVFLSASTVFFTIPYILHTSLPFFIKRFKFNKKYSDFTLKDKNKKKYHAYAIQAGIPLTVSSLSIILYVKVGQIMLGNISGVDTVGVYNAASTIAQGWIFLPLTIMTVGLTKVLKDKKDKYNGFSCISMLCVLTSLCIISVIVKYKFEIVYYSYGEEYLRAIEVLTYLCVASVFSVLGTVSYRVIIHYGGYAFLMKKMFIMAAINIALSFILINEYGLVGASISVMITEILSATILNYFYKSTSLFKIHLNMFNPVKTIKYIR